MEVKFVHLSGSINRFSHVVQVRHLSTHTYEVSTLQWFDGRSERATTRVSDVKSMEWSHICHCH